MESEDKQRRGNKRTWAKRFFFSLFIIVVLCASGLAYATWRAEKIAAELSAGQKGVVVKQAERQLGRSGTDPLANVGRIENSQVFLLIGSDRRWGERGRGRSDTIILARLDPDKNEASLLSIPRDTMVDIPGRGRDKINHSYAYGGPALLIATVKQWLGVPIDHFAEVSFQGFSTTVNDIGGAYLPVDGRYLHVKDGSAESNWAEIDIKPGYQRLSGSDALSWVRFRHLDTDSLRAARQQVFLRELGRQLRAKQSDYANLPGIIQSFAKSSASDINNINELFSLANTARQIPPGQIRRYTMPVSDQMIDGVYYASTDEASKVETLRKWSGQYDDNITDDNIDSETDPGASQASIKTRNQSAPPEAVLVKDTSLKTLIKKASKDQMNLCLPQKLPEDFSWGKSLPFRQYRLNKYPAASAWATAGSGRSINWMWTKWSNSPILERPSEIKRQDNRSYQLYQDSGSLRMVAWQRAGTWTWISNTLDNALSSQEMIALANSCKDLPMPVPVWPALPLLPENKSDRLFLSSR